MLCTYYCISLSYSFIVGTLEPVGGDISIMAEAAMVDTGQMTRAEKMFDYIAKLRVFLRTEKPDPVFLRTEKP